MKIPDKYLSMLENMDYKTRYALFAGLLVFLLILDFFLIMGPQLNMLKKINPKINTLSGDISKAKADIKNVLDYRAKVRDFYASIAEISGRIRSKDELSYILSNISSVASEKGVKIDQIIPNPQDLTLLLEKKDRKYYSVPIIIEARSSYHNFGRFLNDLEQRDISLRIGTFTISALNDEKMHSVNLVLNAIVFEDI